MDYEDGYYIAEFLERNWIWVFLIAMLLLLALDVIVARFPKRDTTDDQFDPYDIDDP